jgi:hypothetical protein
MRGGGRLGNEKSVELDGQLLSFGKGVAKLLGVIGKDYRMRIFSKFIINPYLELLLRAGGQVRHHQGV